MDLVPELQYVKPGRDALEFIFVTDVGAFEYSVLRDEFEFFYLFADFVPVSEGSGGVIYAEEEQKKRNYNLSQQSGNLILLYNPDTQDRSVLYSTSLDITEIFLRDTEVFFIVDGQEYLLENY